MNEKLLLALIVLLVLSPAVSAFDFGQTMNGFFSGVGNAFAAPGRIISGFMKATNPSNSVRGQLMDERNRGVIEATLKARFPFQEFELRPFTAEKLSNVLGDSYAVKIIITSNNVEAFHAFVYKEGAHITYSATELPGKELNSTVSADYSLVRQAMASEVSIDEALGFVLSGKVSIAPFTEAGKAQDLLELVRFFNEG